MCSLFAHEIQSNLGKKKLFILNWSALQCVAVNASRSISIGSGRAKNRVGQNFVRKLSKLIVTGNLPVT